MKKLLFGCAVAGMLLAPTAQAADEPAVFTQTGQWAVDYGDEYCRLAGTFTDGKDELALAIERLQPGPAVRMLIVGASLKTYRSAELFGYSFLPSGAERRIRPLRGETAQGTQFYNFGTLFLGEFTPPAPGAAPTPPPMYDRTVERDLARGITGIALGSGWATPVRIETGSLAGPIRALQACADDLLTQWGLDPAKHQTMTGIAFPAGMASEWLPSGTITFADFAKLSGSTNQVRVLVDASGKPTACEVLWPSLDETANEAICSSIMAKGAFTPAKDKDGQPMASYWMTESVWLVPPFGGRR